MRPAKPVTAVLSVCAVAALAACGSSSNGSSSSGSLSSGSASSSASPGSTGARTPQLAGATVASATGTPAAGSSSGASTQTPAAVPAGTAATASATAQSGSPTPSASASTLPDGTTTILPGHRVVAYYGTSTVPPDDALGLAGSPANAAKQLEEHEQPYATGGVPVLGAFELIATIIQDDPGEDGDHAADLELSTIATYEKEAVKDHLLLILDIQPGTSHYLPHVQRLAKFLAMPNVSIALDPEWQFLTGGFRDVTGSSPASEVNDVSSYLSQFVAAHHLPQKLLMIHQFNTSMLTDRSDVKNEPGVAIVMHIDGIGNGGNAGKLGDYKVLHGTNGQFSGFKLFFKEDTDLLSPQQVLALKPTPNVITYQ